jgi:hypothetical protein
VAVPVASQITQASHSEPYLALKLDLDPHKIADLVLKVFPHGLPPVQERSAVYLAPVDAGMISAATRLMECLAPPGDAELLAPLVIDEILIRRYCAAPSVFAWRKWDLQNPASTESRRQFPGYAPTSLSP